MWTEYGLCCKRRKGCVSRLKSNISCQVSPSASDVVDSHCLGSLLSKMSELSSRCSQQKPQTQSKGCLTVNTMSQYSLPLRKVKTAASVVERLDKRRRTRSCKTLRLEYRILRRLSDRRCGWSDEGACTQPPSHRACSRCPNCLVCRARSDARQPQRDHGKREREREAARRESLCTQHRRVY